VYWAVGFAEIVVIMANESSSSLMKNIVSMLMIGGNEDRLRLTPLSIIGLCTISLGTLLRLWCFRVLEDLFTFEISIRENHRLVKTGPYSVVRHPSYVAVWTLEIGTLCWHTAQGSWLRESGVLGTLIGRAFFGIFTLLSIGVRVALSKRAAVEDAALKKRFGKEWEEWARRVPYSFVPGVY